MRASITVSKFSTGSVQIRPQHVGPTKLPTLAWLLTARSWTLPRPINVYVIRHPHGVVVFDTGQDIASVNETNYFPKGIVGWLYSRLARFEIGERQTFTKGLESLGISKDEIKYVILSHLHQDHIGGLPELAGSSAIVVVSGDELRATEKPFALLDGYMNNHIYLDGITYEMPRFSEITTLGIPGFSEGWDMFNDGKLVVLPLSGHTAGSQGLLVNWNSDNPIFLVGDLTYDASLIPLDIVPGVGDKASLQDISRKVLNLLKIRPELTIAAAHDPNVVLPGVTK